MINSCSSAHLRRVLKDTYIPHSSRESLLKDAVVAEELLQLMEHLCIATRNAHFEKPTPFLGLKSQLLEIKVALPHHCCWRNQNGMRLTMPCRVYFCWILQNQFSQINGLKAARIKKEPFSRLQKVLHSLPTPCRTKRAALAFVGV